MSLVFPISSLDYSFGDSFSELQRKNSNVTFNSTGNYEGHQYKTIEGQYLVRTETTLTFDSNNRLFQVIIFNYGAALDVYNPLVENYRNIYGDPKESNPITTNLSRGFSSATCSFENRNGSVVLMVIIPLDGYNVPYVMCIETWNNTSVRYPRKGESGFLYEESNGGIIITGYTGSSKDITVPNIINSSPVVEIGRDAFKRKGINSVVFPDTLVIIAYGAFNENNLTEVIIPEGVTIIGEWAFARNAIRTLSLPNSISIINASAFLVNQLSALIIPNGCIEIGSGAFAANRLTSVIIPDSVMKIGSSAFENNRLTSVVLPNNLTFLDSELFWKNYIEHIVIPPRVNRIWANVFKENPVKTITIGDNVNLGFDYSLPFDFPAYYNSNDKKAGTYTFYVGKWTYNQNY
jgi:hypothetical protein